MLQVKLFFNLVRLLIDVVEGTTAYMAATGVQNIQSYFVYKCLCDSNSKEEVRTCVFA